jgi:hypothetical protein
LCTKNMRQGDQGDRYWYEMILGLRNRIVIDLISPKALEETQPCHHWKFVKLKHVKMEKCNSLIKTMK